MAKNIQQKSNVASKVWTGVKVFFKWFWLIAMFLLGITSFAAMPFGIFEYSFSLSELDIVETLFCLFLLAYIYKYIKLCRQIDAPIVCKVITPWVHQAYLLLVSVLLTLVSIKLFNLKLIDFERMPLLNFFGYLLIATTLGYSFHRVRTLGTQHKNNMEKVCSEGVTE